jgi:hypothetical protein
MPQRVVARHRGEAVLEHDQAAVHLAAHQHRAGPAFAAHPVPAITVETWQTSRSTLAEIGFTIGHDHDITSNVLLSCDQVARTRVGAFSATNDAAVMRDFLATPGSSVYQSMADRTWHYRILWCKKGMGSPIEDDQPQFM